MPKEISDIRDFLQKARRKDARSVKIQKKADRTKFKIRCSRVSPPPFPPAPRWRAAPIAATRPLVLRFVRTQHNRASSHVASLRSAPLAPAQYLYTLSVKDPEKAEKLTQSLPPGLPRKDI